MCKAREKIESEIRESGMEVALPACNKAEGESKCTKSCGALRLFLQNVKAQASEQPQNQSVVVPA